MKVRPTSHGESAVEKSKSVRRRAARTGKSLLISTAVLALSSTAIAGAHAAVSADVSPGTPITLTPTFDDTNSKLVGDNQGFSVESGDFAHGFITKERMAKRLRTLGDDGVIRVGGYSMDLVWPAFGEFSDVPAPAEAIGGVVDQSDLDSMKSLLDASGWKASIGLPLKSIVDPSQVTNPAKDPSPDVSMEQIIAEVKAAHETLGSDLVAFEVGNEFDLVTRLTGAQMWEMMKTYKAAVETAVPGVDIKLIGPSANTAATNTKLEEFVAAAKADTTTTPQTVLSELSSHLYPGSHCGSSNLSIATLMSASTHTKTQAKLDGIMTVGASLQNVLPMTLNESNSASCSGQPLVSNAYAASLWSLDYQLMVAQTGISRLQFHTNTAAICGDFQPRLSPNYPISYRYYGAFCADDQAALEANELTATPLYYGIWAFSQLPKGTFVDLDVPAADLGKIRAYGIEGRNGDLTVVLINMQDPADAASTTNDVTVDLPGRYETGRAVTLESSAPGGFASLDSKSILLGGRTVAGTGIASGEPRSTKVDVGPDTSTVMVEPGTAQIVTFRAQH